MSKLTKCIDFLVTYESAPLLIHINGKMLENVQIIVYDYFYPFHFANFRIMTNFNHILFNSDELYWVHEMRLVFKTSPNICNQHGHPIKPIEMGAIGKFVDVIFDTGFHRERLLTLLLEMVCWKTQM